MGYKFSNNNYFINPYTFVEGEETKKYEGMAKRGTNTGVFTCRIYPKTPILIPDPFDKSKFRNDDSSNDSSDDNKSEHYAYKFLHIGVGENTKPIIPGSSIRGPLRNMYETLTDSCYATAKPNQYITARPKKAFEPGLIKKTGNNWELHQAKRYKFQIYEYFKELGKPTDPNFSTMSYEDIAKDYGKQVTFNLHTKKVNVNGKDIIQYYATDIGNEKTEKSGYYYIGEYISNKKYESIFSEQNKIEKITPNIIKQAFDALKDTLKVYRDEKVNQKFVKSIGKWNADQHGGYTNVDLEAFERNGGVLPIWYKEVNGKYYFSLASIGRFKYYTPIDSILKKKNKMPCADLKKLCKACSLFGMVGNEEGLGSSIRITDAIFEGNISDSIKEFNLTELRTPHPSYLPFYAKTDNYLSGYDDSKCNIRGRKFYWHFKPDYNKLNSLPEDKIDTKMCGIDKGSFTFKVYFENISDEQLVELATLLCLGENDKDGKRCYKLGHGKPLGFGSAKIVVKNIQIRDFKSKEHKYVIKSCANLGNDIKGWDLFSDNKFDVPLTDIYNSLDNISKVLDFELNSNAEVKYPNVINKSNIPEIDLKDNDLSSAQWFSQNWMFGKKDDKPTNTLPNYKDEDQSLNSVEFRKD